MDITPQTADSLGTIKNAKAVTVTGALTSSSADGLVARAGGGQALGTPITGAISRFITVVTAADSATLPVAAPGSSVTIINAAAANSMNVFPDLGSTINAGGANAAYALAAGKTATFYSTAAGSWYAVLSA